MQERYIATADLGSSKIALCVAKVTGFDIQVIYYKESESDGIRYNCVFNPKRASAKLSEAVREAEEELNLKITQLVVGLPRYSVKQESGNATIERSNPENMISKEEIQNLKETAMDNYPLANPEKEEIYGAVAQSFESEDLMGSENDVVGTTGEKLVGNFKIFVGARKSLKNIDIMLNDCGIALASTVFTPHAVAKAVLTDDERSNGVALVEMGAGVTSLSIYQGRILRFYASIPFAGKSITNDVKYECAFGESLAENIKLAFGACMPEKLQNMTDKVLQVNDEETGSYDILPVKYLSEIITCRCEEIIEAILYLIHESGYSERLRGGLVLTGGGANLTNLANLFKEKSGYSVRIGHPHIKRLSVDGCPDIAGPGAAASVGMVLEASKELFNCAEEIGTANVDFLEEKEEEPKPAVDVEDVQEEPVVEKAESEEKTTVEEKPAVKTAAREIKKEEKTDPIKAIFGTKFDKKPKKEPTTLFGDAEMEGVVLKPKTKKEKTPKAEKEPKARVNWTPRIGPLFEKVFDHTLGSIYDDMTNNE